MVFHFHCHASHKADIQLVSPSHQSYPLQPHLDYPQPLFISAVKALPFLDERVSVQVVPLFVVGFKVSPDLFLVMQSRNGVF